MFHFIDYSFVKSINLKKNICIQFSDYKLVIICSSENEYKSPMISALDKYRTPKIAVAGVRKIKEYLKKKYTPENVSDSAADVDSIGYGYMSNIHFHI